MITYFFLHKSLWSDKRNKKTSQWLMLLELGGGGHQLRIEDIKQLGTE